MKKSTLFKLRLSEEAVEMFTELIDLDPSVSRVYELGNGTLKATTEDKRVWLFRDGFWSQDMEVEDESAY